jgi:hypothetical protein
MDDHRPGARPPFAPEPCGICGGDGRIANSFGSQTTCPSCHGSGRRAEDTGFRDVTKTKPSHYGNKPTNKAEAVAKPQWPVTFEGEKLANEVKASSVCTSEVKARLIREIIEHEGSHGTCTQTFIKKVRKQVRPKVPTP